MVTETAIFLTQPSVLHHELDQHLYHIADVAIVAGDVLALLLINSLNARLIAPECIEQGQLLHT